MTFSNPSKSCGRVWRWIALLLVVLTLGGTPLVFMKRPRPLLARASVALTFEAPWNGNLYALNDGIPIVATLSDTNWLVGQLDQDTDGFVIRYRMDRREFKPFRRFSTPRLESLLNKSGTLVGDIESSPDGRWVIGTLQKSPYYDSPVWRVALPIDGSHIMRWAASLPEYRYDPSSRGVNGSFLAWMPDSHNVAEIVADQFPSGRLRLQGTLHDVYSGRTSTIRFSAPSLPERGAQLAIRPSVLLLSSVSNYDQEWTSPVRRLLRFDFGRKIVKPTGVDLYSWPLHQSDAVPKISHLETPLDTWMVGLAFSPDGKRLAWEVVREIHPSPLERVLCRLWSRPAPMPSEQVEVWTSDIEGSGMEMIGYLPNAKDWNKLHLVWLPGGQGLRFVVEDRIYTVNIYED